MEDISDQTGGCPFHNGDVPDFPQPRVNPLAPPPSYQSWAREAPLKRVRLWNGRDAWLVTGYDEIRALLSDRRVSADSAHPAYPAQYASMLVVRRDYQTFISMDDPEHARHRRMLTGEFTVRSVEALRPALMATSDRLIDAMLKKGPPADFSADFSYPLTVNLMCDFIGVPYEDREYFQGRLSAMMSGKIDGKEAVAIGSEFVDGYIGDLIRRKQAEPTDDVLGRLVVNQLEPGHLNFEQLKAMTRMLINAGHETTANTLNIGLLSLLENRPQWEKLCDDPTLIPGAVEELLRYVDVGHLARRRFALEDIEIAGQQIRAGEAILALAMMGNRDPRRFDDPETLDVERRAQMQMTFGFGVHQCLGQSVARLELVCALQQLSARMRDIRLQVPVSALEFKEQGLSYGVEAVPIVW